ncbi:hypothetical protein DFS34DRAFT_575149 [Phlyctochytrium arcticum]|nr:hypothetical protein DFS34DRAFT_575149 [Phlyctochytrium arcticum]
MRLRHIDRTATISWSPGQYESNGPLLAAGTVAGALDASFSTAAELEIFDLNLGAQPGTPGSKSLRKLGAVNGNARFNRLAWGMLPKDTTQPLGILASGMENGELDLWDPSAIIAGNQQSALIMRHSIHTGPVRGLDFSPVQGNLLASGATDGEVYIWDLTNPTKPYTPGPKSQRLEDISVLSWNRQVAYILGTASNNGYTVLWDLRHKKEIITLAHPGGRKPITALAWNPSVPTQLVTASEDDNAPVVLVWDLRNASAPQKGLQGHQKGVLSLAWCAKDSDMLISCGKDNTALVWNPNTGEMVGELARSHNWAFDVQWCPKNPDLVAVSSFDGHVSVHSLQSSGADETEEPPTPIAQQPVSGDVFDNLAFNQPEQQPTTQFCLKQPPKWLRRPVGAVFGFGGKLVSFDNQTRFVNVAKVATLPEFASRVDELEAVIADGSVEAFKHFCDLRASQSSESNETDREMWSFLKVMLEAGARTQVLDYLGFDRANVGGDRLVHLLQNLKLTAYTKDAEDQPLESTPQPEQTFAHSPTADEPFALYPSAKSGEQGDIDTLITRALLLGDFETAVEVALGAGRLSDALILAVSGGSDLLLRTQQEYFKRQAQSKSYIRVLRSVVNGDLADVVEDADLDGTTGNWKDILALICTYGREDDSAALFSALGRRLEASENHGAQGGNPRENKKFAAVLCYLAAADLKRVVDNWSLREREEEHQLLDDARSTNKKLTTPSVTHVVALQSLIEKVTVFRKAIGFSDPELTQPSGYCELEGLYEHYAEYAEKVATQGKLDLAWSILELIPEGFQWKPSPQGNGSHGPPLGSRDNALATLKDRVFKSGGLRRQVTYQPAPAFEVHDILTPPVAAAPVQQNAYGQQSWQQQQQPAFGGYQNTYAQQQAVSQPAYGRQPVSSVPSYGTVPPPVPASTPYGQVPQQQASYPYQDQAPVANQYQSYGGYSQPSAPPTGPPPSGGFAGAHQPWAQQDTAAPLRMLSPGPTPTGGFGTDYSYAGNPVAPPGASMAPPPTPPLAPGDRSHIPAAHKPLYEGLQKYLDLFKSVSSAVRPQQRRIYDDAEKKLNIMFDQLNAEEVPIDVVENMLELVKALDARDFSSAHRIQVDLMTTRFDVTGKWMLVVKRIIDAAEKIANGGAAQQQQQQQRQQQQQPPQQHQPPPPQQQYSQHQQQQHMPPPPHASGPPQHHLQQQRMGPGPQHPQHPQHQHGPPPPMSGPPPPSQFGAPPSSQNQFHHQVQPIHAPPPSSAPHPGMSWR